MISLSRSGHLESSGRLTAAANPNRMAVVSTPRILTSAMAVKGFTSILFKRLLRMLKTVPSCSALSSLVVTSDRSLRGGWPVHGCMKNTTMSPKLMAMAEVRL